MGDYIYRLLTAEDQAQLNELYKAAFHREKTAGFFNWKYFNNPAGNAIVAGAFYDNKLVGSGALVPEKMNVFRNVQTVYKCTDLMTHPEHQRKGLSKKVNELLIQKIAGTKTPFLYTLCSKISTKSFLKNNWVFLEGVSNYFKPYSFLQMQSLFRKNNFTNILRYNNVYDHLNNYKFKVNENGISVSKTPEYLRWRTSNPNFMYQLICHYDSMNQVDGYLIYSISKNNVLNIIDIECYGDNKKISDELLSYAEYLTVKEKNKGILVMLIKSSPFSRFFKGHHYFKNPLNTGPLKTMIDFDIFKADNNTENITNIDIWDIYGLSYDDI